MAEEVKKHVITLEDGRRGERVVQEEKIDGEEKTITELWVEPVIEKKLSKRVVEYKKPVVHRREIETVDENGDVVERKIESVEPEVKMQLREVIKTESSVQALSVEPDCNCFVTQEEMQKTFTEGMVAVLKALKTDDSKDYYKDEPKVSAMQMVVGDKLQEASKNNISSMGTFLWSTVAILSAVFVYVAIFMS